MASASAAARRGHRRVRVGHRRIRGRLRCFGIGHRRCLIGHGCAGSSLRLTGECVGSAHRRVRIGLGLSDRRRCRFCRRRRQGDLADAGDLQLVAASVLQGTGVADPAHLDVGDGEGSRRHESQLGLRQSHGIGEQLAHRSVDRLHRGAGAAGVFEQSGVGLTAVHDVGDIDGVRTGQGDLHVVQVGHARIEHLGGDHHRGRLVGVRHHGIDLGLCRHGLGFCGARRGHRRVRVGHRRIRRCLRGFGIGHRRCLIGHGRIGSSLRPTHRCGCIGLGLCDRRRCRCCRRRRQGDLTDTGNLQLVAAGVLQGAGVADPAYLDVGDGEGSRRHEGQLGLRQPDGIGSSLPIGP